MLKIILMASLISLSCTANAQVVIYKINYFDRLNNLHQTETYSDFIDLNERVEELNYNDEIFQNIKVSKNILGTDNPVEKKSTYKSTEQMALIKRGGEGGGD